jgi:hypothetical protein
MAVTLTAKPMLRYSDRVNGNGEIVWPGQCIRMKIERSQPRLHVAVKAAPPRPESRATLAEDHIAHTVRVYAQSKTVKGSSVMSENSTPQRTFRQEAAASLDRDGELIVNALRQLVDGDGGTISRRITCSSCGQTHPYAIQTIDTKSRLDAIRLLADQGYGRHQQDSATTRTKDELQKRLDAGQLEMEALSRDELDLFLIGEDVGSLQDRLAEIKAKWAEVDTATAATVLRFEAEEFVEFIKQALLNWGPRHSKSGK